MPSAQHLVSPKLPTVLAGHASVDLPGYDICQFIIEFVYVLPTKLDIPRFEEALSRVLQLYPHTTGQLRCIDGRWFIELTNTGVPVDVDYKFDTMSDALLKGDWVVQDDLSSFVNHPCSSAYSVNGNGPLLCLKLTFLENETCIGISWHHVLGDATLLVALIHTLSQFYQGLPQEHPSPTFQKYRFPKPSSAMTTEFEPCASYLRTTYHLNEIGQVYTEFCRGFENVKWRVDDRDLAELRSVLCTHGRNKGYLSQQDCLTAYVIAILNHNTSVPVQTVMNFTNIRNISAPFIAKHVAGNMVQFIRTTVPADMAGIAAALRHALVQGRKPDFIYGVMAVMSDLTLETANAGRAFDMCQPDNTTFFVNSNTAIDWRSAHFGCPGGCRLYTSGMAKYYLRCFRSNPVRGDDGVWCDRQSTEISMAVQRELKPRLIETLGRGIRYMLKKEHVRV